MPDDRPRKRPVHGVAVHRRAEEAASAPTEEISDNQFPNNENLFSLVAGTTGVHGGTDIMPYCYDMWTKRRDTDFHTWPRTSPMNLLPVHLQL